MNLFQSNTCDVFGVNHKYAVHSTHSDKPLFAMDGVLLQKDVFLFNDLVPLEDGVSFYDLLSLDIMLIPVICTNDQQYTDYNKLFDISDFGLHLQNLRNQLYPDWNLFIFADYYFTKHNFEWSGKMTQSLKGYLGELPLTGLVRNSFFIKNTEETQQTQPNRTMYVDISSGSQIISLNMFDKTQTFLQVVLHGDPLTVYANTPWEFRKKYIIHPNLYNPITGIDWMVRTFNVKQETQRPNCFTNVIITMVRLTDFDVEYRHQFTRSVTGVNTGGGGDNGLCLEHPVICLCNDDDMVYFECEVPGLSTFKFIGYSVMDVPQFDELSHINVCKIDKIKCKRYQKEVVCRYYLAVKCIQRHWRECISNPNFRLCNKRLLAEFETLFV